MIECIKCGGGNWHKIPYMAKVVLLRLDVLLTSLSCPKEVRLGRRGVVSRIWYAWVVLLIWSLSKARFNPVKFIVLCAISVYQFQLTALSNIASDGPSAPNLPPHIKWMVDRRNHLIDGQCDLFYRSCECVLFFSKTLWGWRFKWQVGFKFVNALIL